MKIRYREEKRFMRKSLMVLQIGTSRKRGGFVDFRGDTCAPPNWDSEELIWTWRDATATDLLDLGKQEGA